MKITTLCSFEQSNETCQDSIACQRQYVRKVPNAKNAEKASIGASECCRGCKIAIADSGDNRAGEEERSRKFPVICLERGRPDAVFLQDFWRRLSSVVLVTAISSSDFIIS